MTSTDTTELAAVRIAAKADPLIEICRLIDGRTVAANPADWVIAAAERAGENGMSEVGLLRGAIRLMQNRIDAFTRPPNPTKGCETREVDFFGAPVTIEYDLDLDEDGHTCALCMALVNGRWIDAEEAFDGDTLNEWREQIIAAALEPDDEARNGGYL